MGSAATRPPSSSGRRRAASLNCVVEQRSDASQFVGRTQLTGVSQRDEQGLAFRVADAA